MWAKKIQPEEGDLAALNYSTNPVQFFGQSKGMRSIYSSTQQEKVCPRCSRTFPLTEQYWPLHSRCKSGFDTYCKECKREMDRESYQRHRESRCEKVREYKALNPEKARESERKSRAKNKGKYSAYYKAWYEENKEDVREKQKKYYEDNKEMISTRNKQYREENREKILEQKKKYFAEHKKYFYEYRANRMRNDLDWAMKQKIRWNISNAFRRTGYTKKSQAYKIIGLTYEAFRVYLLQTYKDNYGEEWDGKTPIHLDHIIPLATAKSEDDVIRLCHYTNLQLLKAKDNLAKGSKIV